MECKTIWLNYIIQYDYSYYIDWKHDLWLYMRFRNVKFVLYVEHHLIKFPIISFTVPYVLHLLNTWFIRYIYY